MGGSASDNDNSPGAQKAKTGSAVGYSETTALGTDLTGMTRAEIDRQKAVDQALADKGYTKDYKGVSSSGKKGGVYSIDPKTGEKVAVRSGSFVNDMKQAEANYDYQQAEKAAIADFEARKAKGQFVNPELSKLARGVNTSRQYVVNNPVAFTNAKWQIAYSAPGTSPGQIQAMSGSPGTTYSALGTNPAFSIATLPDSYVGPQRAGVMSGAELLASNLATGKSYAPQGTFADPYGNYLGTTVDETNRDIASLPGGNKNQSYLDQFQKGYNATQAQGVFGKDGLFGTGFLGGEGEREQFSGKGDMKIDKAGNIGFKTTAQSLGDSIGELMVGQMLPYGLGSGFNFNTMTQYGTNVPGYDNIRNTVSFGIPDALGGLLGSKAAPYVGEQVGQAVYDKTGNVQNAILSGIGSSAVTGPAVASGTSAVLKGVGVPANTVLSSDVSISESGGGAYVDKDLDGQFSERLGGSGGGSDDGEGNKIGPTSLMNNTIPGFQAPEILDTTGAYGTDNDLASVQSQFQQDNLKNYFANGSPTSLTGQNVASPGNNPLFNINPAVTYRQSGGKNRNYGNAISNAVTPLVANQSFNDASRRKKFGDAMLGLFG